MNRHTKTLLQEYRNDMKFCRCVDDLLDRMYHFVQGPSVLFCEPVEDVSGGKIGFLMVQGDRRRIFWTKLSDSRICAWVEVLRTPQGRWWASNGGRDLWYLMSPVKDCRYTEDLVRI